MAEQHSPHLWELLDEYPDANLSRSVRLYLGAQSPEYQTKLANGLDYLVDHSSPAFEEAGPADMGGSIVISDQEAPYIMHALMQYKVQQNPPNTRLVGYLNWPKPFDRHIARDTRQLLDDFIRDNPEVPFGYFEDAEDVPVCMGLVRGSPSDMLQPLIKDDALMFSHDADTRRLSPTFLADMYRNYRERNLKVLIPHVYHEPLPGKPNLNQVMSWFDDAELKAMEDFYFDLGISFSAKDYRLAGGYGPDYVGENIVVAGTIAEEHVINLPSDGFVPEAHLATSSRRVVSKLLAGVALDNIWSGKEDFRAHEAYRKLSYEDLDSLPDLSAEERDRLLRQYAANILGRIATKNEFIEDGTAERIDLIFQLEAIKNRLGGPDDMFDFDNWRY
jgi:hypothetical protein